MRPPLAEWLAYHLAKSVGYCGAWALLLAIPTAFVMWGCIGFLGWYGELKMTKRTWAATWGVTVVAALGVTLLGIMSISAGGPRAVASVANEAPSENGQADYKRHSNVDNADPSEETKAVADPYHEGRAAIQRQDYATAFQLFQQLAERGDARAEAATGLIYEYGQGVYGQGVPPRDDAQALAWYFKAADQGYAYAQYSLGLMYEDGRGVPRDHAEAVKWWGKAAQQGFPPAESCLSNRPGCAK